MMKSNLKYTLHYEADQDSLSDLQEQEGAAPVHFIRRGDLLLSLSVASGNTVLENEGNSGETTIIAAGENSQLSEDGQKLTATVDGYPVFSMKKSGKIKTASVSVLPVIEVTADSMHALLNLYPVSGKESFLSAEEIKAILKGMGVVYGIDTYGLEDSLSHYQEGGQGQKEIVVARGIRPLDGKDAYFRFEMEVGPFPGEILRNGRIDFRERKMFVGVDRDQLIATKIPANSGTPGRNILGDELQQKPGRDIKLLASGDVFFNEITGEIRAKYPGVLSIVNGKNIKVSSRQVLSGDVDYSTGNIESRDSVEVKGNIKPGFIVAARGDVLVAGNVDAASVVSKSNIVIGGGVIGQGSTIKTRGDVDVKFIEGARIDAGGNVVVRKEIYYSEVLAEGNISCDETSRVIGGLLIAGGNVCCGNIGSQSSEPAAVSAGVSGYRFKISTSLSHKKEELQNKILEMHQRFGADAHKKKKYKVMKGEFENISAKLKSLNLIPAAAQDSKMEPLKNYTDAHIAVHGTVSAGTLLQIGNVKRVLERDRFHTKFVLDMKQQSIVEIKL